MLAGQKGDDTAHAAAEIYRPRRLRFGQKAAQRRKGAAVAHIERHLLGGPVPEYQRRGDEGGGIGPAGHHIVVNDGERQDELDRHPE